MPSIRMDGILHEDMSFKSRALRETNPNLVKAEREFIAGKRWPEIRVSHDLWLNPNTFLEEDWPSIQSAGPRKVKADRTL